VILKFIVSFNLLTLLKSKLHAENECQIVSLQTFFLFFQEYFTKKEQKLIRDFLQWFHWVLPLGSRVWFQKKKIYLFHLPSLEKKCWFFTKL